MTPVLPFAPVRGWLGFANRPRTARELPWTPEHPHANLVLIEPAGWDEVEEGTAFYAVGAAAPMAVVYSELSRIPYGCDDTPRQMVAFTGPHDPPEGLFWVSDQSGVQAVPITAAAPSVTAASWTAGAVSLEVTRTGDLAGKATLREGERVVWKADWAKPEMTGVERTPADLTNPLDAAAPHLVGAWDLPDGQSVLVLRTVGYEGVTFEVLRKDEKNWTSAGKQYIFLCAV